MRHDCFLCKIYKTGILIVLIYLTGCQTTTLVKPEITGETLAEDILIARQYEETQEWSFAAEMYSYLADNSVQPDRSAYYQKAALMLYKAERFDEIESFYSNLETDDLAAEDLIHRDVILAGLAFNDGKVYQSLATLPDLEAVTHNEYKALALTIRSSGILAIGKPLASAELRIQITEYLDNDFAITENENLIWDALNRISESRIISSLSEPQSNELRGWLELNLIARRSNMLPDKIEPWISQWYELYPDHAASINFAENLLAESRLIYIEPTRVALLLPFSDKYRKVAEAIQNGFLYAYYNDTDNRPALEIVNISENRDDFYLQYNQAIQNGADFIVGPLNKKLVNELILNEELRVPTMTLNYADEDSYGINNLYQFGLRPEDEAEQIADYALINGHYHAVTLTPDTPLGARLHKAFSQRFEALGGQVVDSARYPSAKNDYSVSIKQLMNLNGSQRRHSILQQVTGQSSEFIPRRRQDVDMIFIAGNPRQARLIKPQLKFHHAKDLPVYATSSISSSISNPDADRDLDQIQFVDTPWALDNVNNEDYQNIMKLWPQQNQRYAKFFALGLDAYRLIPSLRRLMVNSEENIALNTGTITVDKEGRVHRQLILATYEKGRAQILKQSVESTEQ
ncbi:MAG: penicillin-binding protein activator [Gammaproteobacteria bacterium]|nr:penicillin-binding protein activator [Gammaproteobacteria bacterium]